MTDWKEILENLLIGLEVENIHDLMSQITPKLAFDLGKAIADGVKEKNKGN